MNDNLLTAYSFLAALSENESDIYRTVYLPICKRAISLFAKEHTSGKDEDIKSVIENEYGISVPTSIVRKLIKAVSKDLSKRQRNNFKFEVFEDGKTFSFQTINFNEIEIIYEKEKRNANQLQTAFENYIKSELENTDDIPSFACFIDRHKQKLSSFFTGKTKKIENNSVEQSYMPHVQFLQYIEINYHELYKTAEQIFMGSIIASYLESEIDLEAKIEDGITYYLDTQVILEALDLQNAEDTQPTLELLKLIADTGGRIRILNTTINEISKIIEKAINHYSKDYPTTTINEACTRTNKTKTWLINANGKLEEYISKTLMANIDTIPDKKINEYSSTEDVNLLGNTRLKKKSAVHDVIAYLHVRERRNENVRLIQKAKYWFITANKNLTNFNISRKVNGFINETIMPEELTSLLFLKNPKKFYSKVSQIGLNELIAQTLSEEYASKDLINDFDIAVKSQSNLSNEDYNILLSAVAVQSTTQIQRLLEEVEKPENFNENIHKLIEKARKEKNKKNEIEKEREKEKEDNAAKRNDLQQKNSDLSTKLNAISEELKQIRIEREQDKEKQENDKKIRRRTKWVYISIIIVLIGVVLILVFPNIINWIKWIIKAIASMGGLWGLINLILNICNKIKK